MSVRPSTEGWYFVGGSDTDGWSLSDMNALRGGSTTTCYDADYCPVCRGFNADYLVPGWLWGHWCGGDSEPLTAEHTLLESTLALEQSLSVLQDDTPYRTSFGTGVVTPMEYLDVSSPPPMFGADGLVYCWGSSRGIVGDTSEYLGGVCVAGNATDNVGCYWATLSMDYGNRITTSQRLGCGTIDTTTGLSEVKVSLSSSSSMISWGTPGTSTSEVRCYEGPGIRLCTYPASATTLMGPTSTHTIGAPESSSFQASSGAAVLPYTAVMYKLCGCSSTTGYGNNVSSVCHLPSGECGACTGASGEYRCGSTVDAHTSDHRVPAFYDKTKIRGVGGFGGFGGGSSGSGLLSSTTRLCWGCPSGTVGQCGLVGSGSLSDCVSYDYNTGLCPTEYVFCGSTGLPSYLPGVPAIAALSGAPLLTTISSLGYTPSDVHYTDGPAPFAFSGDVFSEFPSVGDGTTPAFDGVHCAPFTTTGSTPYGWQSYSEAGLDVATGLNAPSLKESPRGLWTTNTAAILSPPSSTFDVYGYSLRILEQPRYLRVTSDATTDFPGLTIPELEAWCGAAALDACSSRDASGRLSSRARLCFWDNGECRFRYVLQPDYVQ